MKNTEYIPISCSYYDLLEALATQAKQVEIQYSNNEVTEHLQGVIVNFIIENKVEMMVLKSGQRIRLDTLIEVDGNKLSDFSTC